MGSISPDPTEVLFPSIATTAAFLLVLAAFTAVMYYLWWNPLRIQRMLAGQGIQGPPYQLLFGTTRQASQMNVAALHKPLKLSDDILHKVQPHINAWTKAYGRTRIGDVAVPANILVTVTNFKIHHDPDIWGEDAHVFKPERFSEGIAKATNNNMAAFLSFGLGPRMYVVNNFALMEAKIALSIILQRYRFSLSPGYIHCPYKHITIRPLHGIQMILRPIEW